MPAGRLYYRYAMVRDMASEVRGGRDPIAEISGIENFLEADRDSFQVAAGQPAVGGICRNDCVTLGSKENSKRDEDLGDGCRRCGRVLRRQAETGRRGCTFLRAR